MIRRTLPLFLLTLFCIPSPAHAQYIRRSTTEKNKPTQAQFIAPRRLMDLPTAGVLPRAVFDMELRMFARGGVLTATNIGLTNHFTIGLSYGAENMLGIGAPNWNPRVEFNIKLGLISESYVWPGIAVGFESQGFGGWNDSLRRYAHKSRGFYGAVSKTYIFTGFTTGFHGGLNYSMERKDADRSPNFFAGMDMRFSDNVALIGEYDFALNDDNGKIYGKGRGYLNLGIRWVFSDQLDMEADLKDLLQNRRGNTSFGREFRLMYVEHF